MNTKALLALILAGAAGAAAYVVYRRRRAPRQARTFYERLSPTALKALGMDNMSPSAGVDGAGESLPSYHTLGYVFDAVAPYQPAFALPVGAQPAHGAGVYAGRWAPDYLLLHGVN